MIARDSAGHRIYAVGDVHGCRMLLDRTTGLIAADLAARPHARPLVVMLGDYVDRGHDSRGVIDALIGIEAGGVPARFLRGNHDQMMLDFLTGPDDAAEGDAYWTSGPLGGAATLASYGVDAYTADAKARFRDAVPQAHVQFLETTEFLIAIGTYAFAHAGIRPGVPLGAQSREDLIWIRGPFLDHTGALPAVVVHGHTPTRRVEDHGNRIGVDTGAVFGGELSCVVLEDARADLLTPTGPIPLPPVWDH